MQRRLLVFDGVAGSTVGITMLAASGALAPQFGLAHALLATTASPRDGATKP